MLENHRKDYAGAESAYREAIRLDPDNAIADNNLNALLKDPKAQRVLGITRKSFFDFF